IERLSRQFEFSGPTPTVWPRPGDNRACDLPLPADTGRMEPKLGVVGPAPASNLLASSGCLCEQYARSHLGLLVVVVHDSLYAGWFHARTEFAGLHQLNFDFHERHLPGAGPAGL